MPRVARDPRELFRSLSTRKSRMPLGEIPLQELEDDAQGFVRGLFPHSPAIMQCIADICENMKDLKKLLNGSGRAHFILEIAVPEVHHVNAGSSDVIYVMPIVSDTFLPALAPETKGSYIAAAALADALAIAQQIIVDDRPALFNLPESPRSDRNASKRDKSAGKHNSEISQRKEAPIINRSRFNKTAIEKLSNLTNSAILRVWGRLLSGMHNVARSQKKLSGPMRYLPFTPPWLCDGVQFLIGDTTITYTDGILPQRRILHYENGKTILICILLQWLRVEPGSRAVLRHLFETEDVEISDADFNEQELDSVNSYQEPKSKHIHVGLPGTEIVCTVGAFRIMRCDIETLKSGCMLTDVPINAIFSMLARESIAVIDSSICAFIGKRTFQQIRPWMSRERLQNRSRLFLPLHSYRSTHWALAVFVRQDG
eukprot:IDg11673t1